MNMKASIEAFLWAVVVGMGFHVGPHQPDCLDGG